MINVDSENTKVHSIGDLCKIKAEEGLIVKVLQVPI